MLNAKRLLKISIFGPKYHMKKVIDTLYDMNVVHIEDHSKESEDDFDIGEPLKENENYSDMLVKLRAMISNLGIHKKHVKPRDTSVESIEKTLGELHSQASEMLEKKEYFEKLIEIYRRNDVRKAISNLKVDKQQAAEHDIHFLGFINADPMKLKEAVEGISEKYLMETSAFNNLPVIALFVPKKCSEDLAKLLEEHDFSPIDSPIVNEKYNLSTKAGYKFVKVGSQRSDVEKKLSDVESEMKSFRKHNEKFILEAEERISREVEKAEAPLRFATTKSTFYMKGWVPKKNAKKLKKEIDDQTDKKVMVKFEKPEKGEEVPVEFDHPAIVKPFESFMELYTLPSYHEIDPTFFMFLTFPLFFGFMLGDVGYGLLTLALFLFLKKKFPGAKNMLNAFVIASISTIVFGFIFGEYFGFETVSPAIGQALGIQPHEFHGEIVYSIPHLFARSHQINDLLSISVLFGLVHVLFGLIIGFINIYSAHGLKHAIEEKGGWLMIFPLIAWLLVGPLNVVTGYVANMINAVLPPFQVVVGLFVVGAIVTIKGEGITGAIEVLFFALLSNVLSYARLMAVGLASLSLAAVVNDLAGQMISGLGIIGIIPALFILLLGHGINIALGILSPFLHSVRLHYVEFFGKFYKGGGKRFKSFGRT